MSNHEKRELKKQQKKEEKQQIHKEKNKSVSKNTKYILISVILILVLAGSYYFIIRPINEFKPYTKGAVHWHANYEVYLCGERQDFTKGYDFEKDNLGTHILHPHNDNTIHLEGAIPKKEDILLGNFFDNIRIPFSSEKIMDKKNGDLCDGKPGKINMYVNGKPNNDFRKYQLKPCESKNIKEDCETIEIRFE